MLSPASTSNHQNDSNCERFGHFLNSNRDYRSNFFKVIGSGGIILDIDTKQLLVVQGEYKWSLPKGHIEKGENYYQCASREIKEETNLDTNINAKNFYIVVKKCVYYLILIKRDHNMCLKPIDPLEIRDIQWFSIDKLKTLNCNRQLDYVLTHWNHILGMFKKHESKVLKININQESEKNYYSQLKILN